MRSESASALGEHIENVPLVDHHVHGCWLEARDRARFENGLNEANTEPVADFDSAFDITNQMIGIMVRRGTLSPTARSLPARWA